MPLSTISRALLLTVYEYLLITFPVGLYICLEAAHEEKWETLWNTPKWSVATVFLVFQGLTLYVRFLNSSGGKVSPAVIGLGGILSLGVIVVTIINTWISLDPTHNSKDAITLRLLILLIVSAFFGLFVWSARQYQMKGGRSHGEDI